jgi:hypothetical protein
MWAGEGATLFEGGSIDLAKVTQADAVGKACPAVKVGGAATRPHHQRHASLPTARLGQRRSSASAYRHIEREDLIL